MAALPLRCPEPVLPSKCHWGDTCMRCQDATAIKLKHSGFTDIVLWRGTVRMGIVIESLLAVGFLHCARWQPKMIGHCKRCGVTIFKTGHLAIVYLNPCSLFFRFGEAWHYATAAYAQRGANCHCRHDIFHGYPWVVCYLIGHFSRL